MSGLAKKLGIKSGQSICLLNPTAEMDVLLRGELPEGVSVSDTLGCGQYDIIISWPTRLAELSDRFAELQHHILPDGAIWAVIPKKRFVEARGIDLSWRDMQGAALKTNLVDNITASLSEEEYATRFVIRKERRGGKGEPHHCRQQ